MSQSERSAERFRLKSPDERQQCVNRLIEGVTGPGRADDDEAFFLETLAKHGLIEDPALIHPLIECVSKDVSINPGGAGSFCNRTLAALTRQSYGLLFAGESRMPVDRDEHQRRVVADWTEYARLLEKGLPVFDPFLSDASASAMRTVRARLVDTLARSVPNHVILSYLGNSGPATIPRKQGQAQVIDFFGIGDPGRGFSSPGNWLIGKSDLRGLRILLFRPGVPHPRSDLRLETEIQQFPAEDADYHEVFHALDLEIRFQIVTSSVDLRQMTVVAVREALKGLRDVNAKRVR